MEESIVVKKLLEWLHEHGVSTSIADLQDEDYRGHYLSDFGLDSIDTVEFLWDLEDELQIVIDEDALDYESVGTFLDSLRRYVEEQIDV